MLLRQMPEWPSDADMRARLLQLLGDLGVVLWTGLDAAAISFQPNVCSLWASVPQEIPTMKKRSFGRNHLTRMSRLALLMDLVSGNALVRGLRTGVEQLSS